MKLGLHDSVLGLPVIDDRPQPDESPLLWDGQDFEQLYADPEIRPTTPDVIQIEMEDLDQYNVYVCQSLTPGPNQYKMLEFRDPDVLERFLFKHIPEETERKYNMIRMGLALMANYRIANLYLKEGRADKVIPKRPTMLK